MSDFILLRGEALNLTHLHIGTGRNIGNFYPTNDYIPANVIRGMLGNYLHEEHPRSFEETGISDDEEPTMFFKPAYFEGQKAVPASIRWCKGNEKHIIPSDNLICSVCQNEGKMIRGYLHLERSIEEKKLVSSSLESRKTIYTKCPIVKERHTSYAGDEDLSPYNIESIVPGLVFPFTIVIPKHLSNDIQVWLKEAGIFYGAGGFRSKGHGVLLFKFEDNTVDVKDYIIRRATELGEGNKLIVINSPTALRGKENNNYSIGFDKDVMKKEINTIVHRYGRMFDIQPTDNVNLSSVVFDETLIRGWTIKSHYHLKEMIPAIALGSSAIIDLDPRICALLEIFGLGLNNHINGDLYFIGSDSV